MSKINKKGFTLAEVVIACSIFAIVVVGIILAINRSFIYMNNTKLAVRATNLAREGVEMMYAIRDTNWRIHSGDRDKYRLNLGQRSMGNTNLSFTKGIYAIYEGKDNGNSYLYLNSLSISDVNLDDFYSNDGFWKDSYETQRNNAKLQFTGEYSYYELNSDGEQKLKTGKIDDELVGDGLEFYRIVRVFGIYCKGDPNPNPNKEVDNSNCKNDSDPKEMRFCVKVFYRGNGEHASELCSIMTNFME